MSETLSEEELREQLLRERETYARKAATPEQRLEAARMFTVAERLSRRGRTQVRTIKLPDDLGDISIDVMPVSQRVITEFAEIQAKFAGGFKDAGPEGLIKMEDRLSHLLGDDICAPGQGLDYEFWKNGKYEPKLPFELIRAVMSAEYDDGADFRKDIAGKAKGRALHKDGKKAERARTNAP